MNHFSIHTFQLRSYISHEEYNELKDKYKKNYFYTDKGKKKITKYQNAGLRIELIKITKNQRYKHTEIRKYHSHNFDIIINPLKVIDNSDMISIIESTQIIYALKKANKIIREITDCFSYPYILDHFILQRIDLCVNINVGSSENVSTIISVLNKDIQKTGFKTKFNIVKHKGYIKSACTTPIENKSQGISLSIYNKEAQLENINNNSARDATGLLRFELGLSRKYIIREDVANRLLTSELICYFCKNSQKLITEFVDKYMNAGAFVTTETAFNFISECHFSEKVICKMQELILLTTKTHRLGSSLNTICLSDYKKQTRLIKRFQGLALSPVTIGKNRKPIFMPSLKSFMGMDIPQMEREYILLLFTFDSHPKLQQQLNNWIQFYKERGVTIARSL